MNNDLLKASVHERAEFSFSRAGGPGGQNVNKVNSKVTLRVDLRKLEGINEEERARLLVKLSYRLIDESILQIQVQDERSQLLNRETALERVFAIIQKGLEQKRPRKATKPTRAAKEKRLKVKRLLSAHKKNRIKPHPHDD